MSLQDLSSYRLRAQTSALDFHLTIKDFLKTIYWSESYSDHSYFTRRLSDVEPCWWYYVFVWKGNRRGEEKLSSCAYASRSEEAITPSDAINSSTLSSHSLWILMFFCHLILSEWIWLTFYFPFSYNFYYYRILSNSDIQCFESC